MPYLVEGTFSHVASKCHHGATVMLCCVASEELQEMAGWHSDGQPSYDLAFYQPSQLAYGMVECPKLIVFLSKNKSSMVGKLKLVSLQLVSKPSTGRKERDAWVLVKPEQRDKAWVLISLRDGDDILNS